MPECTPQKDNLAFRGEDFKVNSVQEIPFGFRLIRAGEQITRRAIAFWLWLARFWHFSQPFSFAVLVGVPPICSTRGKNRNSYAYQRGRPLCGRPDFRGEGVRVIDLRATSLKLNPLGRPTGLVRNRSGEPETRGNYRCLPSTGSARASHARRSSEDCQRQRYLESAADRSWGRQLRDRWLSGTTRQVLRLSRQGRYGC